MSDPFPVSGERGPMPVRPSKTRGRLRLAAQIVAFLCFLALVLATQREYYARLPHDLFFLIDPLAGLASMIASRSVIVPMLIGGLALLAVTLIFGRVWCGWICPSGSLLDWIPARRAGKGQSDIPRFWRHGKNVTLFMVIFGAILGGLTLMVLDPVTLMFRTLAAGILPLANSVLMRAGAWLYDAGLLRSAVGWFDSSVRATLLGGQGFYLPNLTLLLFFFGVLALNAIRRRFWCRYLCPLGGMLALVSRVSFFRYRRDGTKCVSCGRCVARCHTYAIDPESEYAADSAECTACLGCVDDCPTQAIAYSPGRLSGPGFQPERRRFLQSAGLAAVGAAVLAFLPTPGRNTPTSIRPPGSSEGSIAAKCVRCGECVRVCPSGSVQPAASAAGWDDTWSPHLVMRRGCCDYSCNACGQVCPTGAISALTLEEKRRKVIGTAVVNRERCIPYAEGRECGVCEEMCPLPRKAIALRRGGGGGGGGAARPHVIPDLCIGCGICEHQCPVNGEAAIRVFPLAKS